VLTTTIALSCNSTTNDTKELHDAKVVRFKKVVRVGAGMGVPQEVRFTKVVQQFRKKLIKVEGLLKTKVWWENATLMSKLRFL
jgi:hypothetical protein